MTQSPNSVLEGLLADMLAGMPAAQLTPATRITRNCVPVTLAVDVLPGLTSVGAYKILSRDADDSSVCFAGQLWFDQEAAICAVRIKTAGDAISECEIIRGPARFPGETGVDARTLTTPRAVFFERIAEERRLSREQLMAIAQGYYDAVNQENPALASLDPAGSRIEQGTEITNNPAFRFEFYEALDGQDLPNFGCWSAREQFERGLWNADTVPQVRFASVDSEYGIVCAFMTYRPWGKRAWVDVEGVGKVGPIGGGTRRVGLNAMEVFKIDAGSILEMESVWSMEAGDFLNPWSECP